MHQTLGYITEYVSVNLNTHDLSTLKEQTISSTQTDCSLGSFILSVKKMKMLKEETNLEHDRGQSLYSICSLINGTRVSL